MRLGTEIHDRPWRDGWFATYRNRPAHAQSVLWRAQPSFTSGVDLSGRDADGRECAGGIGKGVGRAVTVLSLPLPFAKASRRGLADRGDCSIAKTQVSFPAPALSDAERCGQSHHSALVVRPLWP